jgi:hypothetical protein
MAKVSKPNFASTTVNPWDIEGYGNNISYDERANLIKVAELAEQKKLARFSAITGVYQLADSILTGTSLEVRAGDFTNMTNGSKAVAWNDGKTIFLNTQRLHEIDDNTIVSLNGINYHEVAHVIWSPRNGGTFAKRVVTNGYLVAFNSLEDQRIETLMVSRFPSTVTALTKASLTYLLNCEPDKISNVYPLIRGRRFLPLEIRQMACDLFVAKHGARIASEVARLVDEYRLLSFDKDKDRAYEIVAEYGDLLGLRNTEPFMNNPKYGDEGEPCYIGNPEHDPNRVAKSATPMCDDRLPMKSGRAEAGKKQEAQADKVKANDGTGDTVLGEGVAGADKDSDKLHQDMSNSEAGIGNANTEVEYDPNANTNIRDKELIDLVKSEVDNLMRTSQARNEVGQIRNAIRQSDMATSMVAKASATLAPIEPEYRQASRDFANELSRLVIDNDPAWERSNPTGKLNVQRAMNMSVNDLNTVFDRWSEGNDNFDIEAVILIDNSGSMGGSMGQACQAMWAIKRALEDIDGRVAVYTFNDNAKELYASGERAGIEFKAVGASNGTNPYEALLEAERILTASRRKTKLLFVISDGQWGYSETNNELVKRINDIEGVISNSVLMVSPWYLKHYDTITIKNMVNEARHNCHSVAMVTKPSELVDVARNLLRQL